MMSPNSNVFARVIAFDVKVFDLPKFLPQQITRVLLTVLSPEAGRDHYSDARPM